MYITNLGIRITHLQNSFQVQQMAGDAAPSRGTKRLKHFHQPEEPHTESPCLSISKAPGKNLSLEHLAGERIPKQLSTFSITLEVQRKKEKKKKPCKIYLGTLHRSIESTLFDWPDLLVTTLSEQPCPLWWPQTLVQQCTNTELLLETRLQGTTLQRTYFSFPAELTSLFHWKLDGVSQTIVKFLFLNST